MNKRIIVCVVIHNGEVHKTFNFAPNIYCGDPVNICAIYSDFSVDEILVIDLDAKENGLNKDLLKNLVSDCFVPISYCGGIKDMSEAQFLINVGYDRLGFGINDIESKINFISKVSKEFGRQAVIGLISYSLQQNERIIKTSAAEIRMEEYLKKLKPEIFAEIIFQCIPYDGSYCGLDTTVLDIIKNFAIQNIVLSCGAQSFEEVETCMLNYDISIGVSSITTLYEGNGVLLQWKP